MKNIEIGYELRCFLIFLTLCLTVCFITNTISDFMQKSDAKVRSIDRCVYVLKFENGKCITHTVDYKEIENEQ